VSRPESGLILSKKKRHGVTWAKGWELSRFRGGMRKKGLAKQVREGLEMWDRR
jgi:hypothetical protein